ncbi:MAG: SGNH/GDSL hydrolase family protein [Marinicella sp.]
MKNSFVTLLLLSVFTWATAEQNTNKHTSAKTQKQTEFNVLFVGNSLTNSNNLPRLVARHAATHGITVTTKMVAKGGYAIVDHWAEGNVQRLIRSNQYDFVVIQQGPSSQFDGYDMLVNGGAEYAQICEENNAQLAYFMVWPALNRYFSFEGVIRNYTAGAEANNALLIPVGSIWKQYIDSTGDHSYFSSDGFHPSLAGSQNAAEIIVDTLFLNPSCTCEN